MAWPAALIGNVSWEMAAAAVVALVLVMSVWFRFTRYRLGRHEFEVLLGNFVVRRVYLRDIDRVSLGSRFPCEFWPSVAWWKGGCLTIHRKRGFLRHLTVTPRHPEQMRINLCYALGWNPGP